MKEEISKRLWKNIQHNAVELRLPTDQAIADHCGISLSSLRRIKRGDANLTQTLINKIEDKMGIKHSPPEPTNGAIRESMDLEKDVLIEIRGKVWATPDRFSYQASHGTFIKGKPGQAGCFAVEIEGDSMTPAYCPGDIAICRPKQMELLPYSEADDAPVYVPLDKMISLNHKDCIVEHNGETMLKRIGIARKGGPKYEIQMLSLNEKYRPVTVRYGDVWRVSGIVIEVRKREVEL